MEKKEIAIPVFDGEDYSMWKIRIKMFLKFKKCEEVITRERESTDKEDDWKELDLKAINLIYSTISNKQLEFISEEDTAYKIIKKFDEMYLRESTALQIVCRNKLEKMRLEKYSDTATFFIEFEKAVNDLKGAGAKISEKEKLNYMLNTLPSQYSYIGDLIDTLKEADQTTAYIKSKIQIAEMKIIEEKEEKKTNVFMTKGGNCYKCGKTGHFARECQEGQAGQAGSSGGSWRGSTRGRGRGRGRRGNQNRGRGNYRQHGATGTSEQSGQGPSAWVATASEAKIKTGRLCMSEIEWLLDSGCTDHIINNEKYFENCIDLKKPVNIYLGDNRSVKATKIGNVVSDFYAFKNKNKVIMSNVYYAKEMNANLVSYGKLTQKNTIVSKGNQTKIIDENNRLIAVAFKENNVFKLKSSMNYNENYAYSVECNNNMTLKEKWHRKLGHVNFSYLNILSSQQLVEGIPNDLEKEYMKCKTCIENKMHNIPFKNNRTKANDILEIIHTDVCGSFKTKGVNGENYFVSVIDDYSKIAKVYCIKSKDEVFNCLVQFINESENLTGKKVKVVRCDNGKEYLNNRFYKFAREKGIILSNCPTYVHELNGTAERFNRTIMDKARCLLAEAQVHKCYWPEIICAATYLRNRTLANTVERKTPYEIFFRKKPNVENLRLYGSRVFVRKPEQKRSSKWDKKADMGILLGYSDVGYRVLLNNKIIVARHVDIVEKDMGCIGMDDDDTNSDIGSETDTDDNVFVETPGKDKIAVEEKKEKLKSPRRPVREKKSPVRYPENESYNIYVNYSRLEAPHTFEEAMESTENQKWKRAMDSEIKSLKENKTWELVENVENKRVLEVKWVYTRKSDDSYKARLVVRGFQQTNVVDDIYAPVAKSQTLKILLAFCCQNGLMIEQVDVVTAFLNGKVISEVYVNQPKGYENRTNKVCKLLKALYGLRESPRAWYECFDKYVTKLKFERSNVDNCLYTYGKGDERVYMLLYVDDLLICSKNKINIERLKKALMNKFKMKELGEIKEYLGISIENNYRENVVTMNQTKYIESLARKYQIESGRLYSTPMETNLKIEKADECNSRIKYRNLIGALLYISSNTRPDISFSVNYLSRYQNNSNESHWKYALRILKYLYLTKDLKLIFERNMNIEILDCHVDADWAGDNVDRKSTTGYMIRLFGNVIDWKSRKQKGVTKASTYAEYVALSEAVSEVKFIVELLKDFKIELQTPVKIFEDNSGAVNIANYGNFTKNSKHVEIHYHYVHEYIMEGLIEVCKISSDENVADIFTKALCKRKFVKFRKLLNVM